MAERRQAVLVAGTSALVFLDLHGVLVLNGVAVHHNWRQNGLSVN